MSKTHTGWRNAIPFGLLSEKPRHIREVARVAFENRDNLGYAWRILRDGVCDGCSLGPRGLRDDVIEGVHLCTTRLRLLRLNTMPAFTDRAVEDVARLRQLTNEELQQLGRVPHPYIWKKGERGFRRISWDEALDAAAFAITRTAPERLGFFATSRGITNEAYYIFQKSARLLGSNHVDLCARLCHAASVAALKDMIGIGAPTCSLSDFIGTDLLVLVGTDLANNQPVSTKYMAVAKDRGTRIVVINPYREPGLERYWVPSLPKSALFGTKLQDDFFQVRVGGDIAFLNGVLKGLLERGAVDREFVEQHTSDFESIELYIKDLSWNSIAESAGATRDEIMRFVDIYSKARTSVWCYSMGLTQHRFGVQNVMALINVVLSRGMIGREKCGIMPIRGHSGVQGGGEMAVDPSKLPGLGIINETTAAKMSETWGARVPAWHGFRTPELVEACGRGEIDMLYSVGGNLFATMPDPKFVEHAMSLVRTRIHQDIVINTSTLLDPGESVLLLPAQTRYEHAGGVTSTNTERRIRFSPEIPGPRIGEAKPEWEIPALIAMRARPELKQSLHYENTMQIREEIARVVPLYKGIENLKKAGDWVQWGGPMLCAGGRFEGMPADRAEFRIVKMPDVAVPDGKFYLSTRRGKQFNSITFGTKDPLTGSISRDEVFINEGDARKLNIKNGERVLLKSATGEMRGVARIADVAAGNLVAQWPEANVLISRRADPISGEPDYNAIVSIERA
ncbi:MAG: FdhF/YdeP family oxidoreductase [Planctomycetes bacterium]|nr:FdhF/YdeP family oxidoreductase [Planctomycetota bacterium]